MVKKDQRQLVQTVASINKDLVRGGESAGQPVQTSECSASLPFLGTVFVRVRCYTTKRQVVAATAVSRYVYLHSSDSAALASSIDKDSRRS